MMVTQADEQRGKAMENKCGCHVHTAQREAEAQAGFDLTKDLSTQERTYVVGLPVVITISADGKVSIDVDLSEASDLDDASGDLLNLLQFDSPGDATPLTPEEQSIIEAQITEDEHIIGDAIEDKVATIGSTMLVTG